MSYTDKFTATDELITHLSTIVSNITDSQMQANYAGFLSVSAVTVFELAIKEIIIDFANKKHQTFGVYVNGKYQKINGRIKLFDIRNEHLLPFGQKYLTRFNNHLTKKENFYFQRNRISIKSSYGNLITCRHTYVHEGNSTLTFSEVVKSYQSSKHLIECLFITLRM